jgi:hypothetical protein
VPIQYQLFAERLLPIQKRREGKGPPLELSWDVVRLIFQFVCNPFERVVCRESTIMFCCCLFQGMVRYEYMAVDVIFFRWEKKELIDLPAFEQLVRQMH